VSPELATIRVLFGNSSLTASTSLDMNLSLIMKSKITDGSASSINALIREMNTALKMLLDLNLKNQFISVSHTVSLTS